MARLTFVCIFFFVLAFKASRTLKVMIVTHFQLFFRCPGASKKEPKGRPTFAFFVSFFVLGPNGFQGGPRRCPREPRGAQKKSKGDPKGVQGGPRGTQKGSRGTQKGSKGSPGGRKRNPGGAPAGYGGGKAAGNWIRRAMPKA